MSSEATMTFEFDAEITQAWRRLYALEQRPFAEFIKDVIAKATMKYDAVQITESINALVGSLPTTLDYRALREQIIQERMTVIL